MSDIESHRQLLKRFYEAFNAHDLDALDEIVAQDMIDHDPGHGQSPGLVGLKESLDDFRIAFPDMVVENQATVIEGDIAMVRSLCKGTHTGDLLGIAGTGKYIEFGAIDNWRIEDNMIVECWHIEDRAKMLFKLGFIGLPSDMKR